MTAALAVKLVSAVAYVSFLVAALGSAVYLWFARSAQDEKVGDLFTGLIKTRVKLDLMYLVIGLAAVIVSLGLATAALARGWTAGAQTTLARRSLLPGVVLLVYYAPVTVIAFLRRNATEAAGLRRLAWLVIGGVVPMSAMLALQYLL